MFKDKKADTEVKKQIKKFQNLIQTLRKDFLNTSRDQLSMQSKVDSMKKDRTVYNRGEMWFTKWKAIPKNIMGKYQDSREDPVQVYRLLKLAIVDEPEKADHEKIVKLIKRYHDALPEDADLAVSRSYLTVRLAELQAMSKKDNYTRQELLRISATILSPEDAGKADLKMNRQNRELKEYAEFKVQQAVKSNLKKTTLKPEDAWIDNPFNRKRQFVHNLVVENKPLPKAMIRNDGTPSRGYGRGRGRGRGRGQNRYNKSYSNNTVKYDNQGSSQSYGHNRGGRGGGSRGRGRGGRAPRAAPVTDATKENVKPIECESIVSSKPSKIPKYDVSKIPERLDHFGEVCDEIGKQLQDQLIHRNIEVDSN